MGFLLLFFRRNLVLVQEVLDVPKSQSSLADPKMQISPGGDTSHAIVSIQVELTKYISLSDTLLGGMGGKHQVRSNFKYLILSH